MTTSYRNVFLLACCQALLLTNAAGLIAMNGLVGYSLVDTKTLATLGATTYVLGSAAGDDADVAVDGQGGPPARLHDRRAHQHRRLRVGGRGAVAAQLRAVLPRHRGDRRLQRHRPSVPVRCGGGGKQGGQGARDLARARRRHRRRISRSRDHAVGQGPIRGAVPGLVRAACRRWRWSRWRVQSQVHVPKPSVRGALGRRQAAARDRAPARFRRRRRSRRRWATAS